MTELLLRGLEQLDITPTRGQVDSFLTYLRELKQWNRAYSLTSLKTDEEIIVKHFLDSCLYLGVTAPGEKGRRVLLRIADVGSGAGFPGIPMKILRPEIKMYLIEPSKKKTAFLRHIIRTLGLKDINVIDKRVKDVKDIEVDAAVTRALFSTGEFVKKASHIVKKGGLFVLSKGPGVKEELKDSKVDYELKVLLLPVSDIKRYLVLVRKDDGP